MENIFNMDFSTYVALAVILYSIREAVAINNRFIPLLAILLGVGFAFLDMERFDTEVLTLGIQYGAYAVASVASIKYALGQGGESSPNIEREGK